MTLSSSLSKTFGLGLLTRRERSGAPKDTASVIQTLHAALPSGGLITDPTACAAFSAGPGLQRAAPPFAVVLPETTEHVARIAAVSRAAGLSLVIRGGGSSFQERREAQRQRLLVSMAKMRKAYGVNKADRCVRVQVGISLADLDRQAADAGLVLPIALVSNDIATVGGTLVSDANAPSRLMFGRLGDHVSALTAVLPDGSIVRIGDQGIEPGPAGLARAIASLAGRGCILTELTIQLRARPKVVREVIAGWPSWSKAISALQAAGTQRCGWLSAIVADGALSRPGAFDLAKDAPKPSVLSVIAVAGVAEDVNTLSDALTEQLRLRGPSVLEQRTRDDTAALGGQTAALSRALYLDIRPSPHRVLVEISVLPPQLDAGLKAVMELVAKRGARCRILVRPVEGLILAAMDCDTVEASHVDVTAFLSDLDEAADAFGGRVVRLDGSMRARGEEPAGREKGGISAVEREFVRAVLAPKS
ncbi:MAG: FAD-binding oxidoreductase [Pseudomonadota bacterium]